MTAVRPDGFTGSLIAAEGFSDVRLLLHGPGGCRFRYARLSNELYPRDDGCTGFEGPPFIGRSRVPCTYVEEEDYVFGGRDKIRSVLEAVASVDDATIVVMNSPGVALIGDDVPRAIESCGLGGRAFTVDYNPVSLSMCEGFDMMIECLLKFASPDRSEKKDRVNLIGVPIICKDWAGTVAEATRLLGAMGLDVAMSVGSGCSFRDLKDAATSEYNVSVFPEYCVRTSRYFEKEFDIRTNRCDVAPIGFDATEEWLRSVADLTGRDPRPALTMVEHAREKAHDILSSDDRVAGKMRGIHFCIDGESSVVSPLTRWLFEYLGMIPDSVSAPDLSCGGLYDFLESKGLCDVADRLVHDSDCMLSSGDYASTSKLSGRFQFSVDLGFPPRRGFNFHNGTMIGCTGTMNLLDEIYRQ